MLHRRAREVVGLLLCVMRMVVFPLPKLDDCREMSSAAQTCYDEGVCRQWSV